MVFDFENSTETDCAFHILQEKGQPMWYRDLIEEVIAKKKKPIQSVSHTISEIYTLINMDSRFSYNEAASKNEGRGMWGLAEWAAEESKQSTEDKA